MNLNGTEQELDWFDDDSDQTIDFQIDEYDLTQSPNDFNVSTIFSFIESGSVKIPGFQRHFVWELSRASKLIESIILGLPVPQIFLYEESRNKFLVIDGQQRLMSIYYFIKGRFPKKDIRAQLRDIFDSQGHIPSNILHDDDYFQPFKLRLTGKIDRPNKFEGMTYQTLGDYKSQLELRAIRNVIIKQNSPKDDDSSIYEIFNRLNSGGINLMPQEIRMSLYDSKFYKTLHEINHDERWRKLLGQKEPDLHNKDIEILLRSFAMLIDSKSYSSSMVHFLNLFSKKSVENNVEQNEYLKLLFGSFLDACSGLTSQSFINEGNRRFSIGLFEATFTAACLTAFESRTLVKGAVDPNSIQQLEKDPDFSVGSMYRTTAAANVKRRLKRAVEIIRLYER